MNDNSIAQHIGNGLIVDRADSEQKRLEKSRLRGDCILVIRRDGVRVLRGRYEKRSAIGIDCANVSYLIIVNSLSERRSAALLFGAGLIAGGVYNNQKVARPSRDGTENLIKSSVQILSDTIQNSVVVERIFRKRNVLSVVRCPLVERFRDPRGTVRKDQPRLRHAVHTDDCLRRGVTRSGKFYSVFQVVVAYSFPLKVDRARGDCLSVDLFRGRRHRKT